MQPTYFSYPTGLRAPGADWEPKNFRLSALRELASPRANSRNEKSHRKLVRDSERESGCDRISWAKDKSFSALFTSLSLPLPPRLVSSPLDFTCTSFLKPLSHDDSRNWSLHDYQSIGYSTIVILTYSM